MTRSLRAAFTFIEIAVVIIIIGILAAMVVPKFGALTDDAKTSATQGAVGGVRASIAGFRSARLLAGGNPFPTLTELTTVGTVVENPIPANPFTGVSGVQSVSSASATARSVSNTTRYGWNYFVDNSSSPPKAIFYPNCTNATTLKDAQGVTIGANQL